MPRRTKAATAAGQPPSADPTEFVGRNAAGAVRPADDRYLADAELDERDRYLFEVTGREAQQLVHKRETLRVLLDQVEDERLVGNVDQADGLEGDALRDHLEDSATLMPNAEYRRLVEALEDEISNQSTADAVEEGDDQ